MLKIHMNTPSLILLSFCWLIGCGNKGPSASAQNQKATEGKTEKLSIAQKLKENGHLPIEEQITLYRKLKKEDPDKYNFENEDQLTMYGYSFLWSNKIKEALAIFKLIVEQFPGSSNPYDSLGEAYLANGDTALALTNYEISLKMDPDNFGATDQIQHIKHPEIKSETPAQKFAKVYTANEYKDDLDQLGKKLLEIHPAALKFISQKDFLTIVEEKKALITENTSYAEFNWHCSEIIAAVHCSHTSMGSFYPEDEMLPLALRFPLQTRWVNDQLFIIDPLNNKEKVKLKDEILSINGKPVTVILKEIYKHIPAQGYIQTTKKHFFNTWSTGLIPYSLGFPKTYEVTLKGNKGSVALNKAERFQNMHGDASITSCGADLCLETLDDGKTAILTVSSFVYYRWNNFKVFSDFMDRSFIEINKKGIKKLIIDVRFNGGGSPESAIYLLRYLVDKPFTYYSNVQYKGKIEKTEGEEIQEPFEGRYKGKLYFIMDGFGNSTTGHFMSLVKVLNLGTIVGEELGSNQFCSAGQKICRLSNTKLVFYIANNTNETTATSLPDEKGILPDHYVTQSIDEYLNNIDVVKEFTIKLTKNK